MIERLYIRGVGPMHEATLEFGKRVTLLTGENGLGKSFVLDVAWWAMTRCWPSFPATPELGVSDEPRIEWDFMGRSGPSSGSSVFNIEEGVWPRGPGRPTNPGLVIYARADGSFAVWDPSRNYWRTAESVGVDQPDRPGAFLFSSAEVWEGLEVGGQVVSNGLLDDWVVWQLEDGAPFQQLRAVLSQLVEHGQTVKPGPAMRVLGGGARRYPSLDMGYAVVPIVHASAGLRRIAALAYLLVWTWQEHLLAVSQQRRQQPATDITILVDEIEAHLHPKWQRVILPALLDVMHALGQEGGSRVQVIAATHSPLLPTSLESRFDPEIDSLITIDQDHPEDRPYFHSVDWTRRGTAGSWLQSDLFDLAEPRSVEAEAALIAARAVALEPEPTLEAVLRVDRQLRGSLASEDPLFVRWNSFLASVRDRGG